MRQRSRAQVQTGRCIGERIGHRRANKKVKKSPDESGLSEGGNAHDLGVVTVAHFARAANRESCDPETFAGGVVFLSHSIDAVRPPAAQSWIFF